MSDELSMTQPSNQFLRETVASTDEIVEVKHSGELWLMGCGPQQERGAQNSALGSEVSAPAENPQHETAQ